MTTIRSSLWRLFFVLSALLLVAGGPRHPAGTMAEMLAHPDWVPSHALMLAGFVSLLVGLLLYQRSVPLPDGTRTWARLAVLATALMVVETAFHTAASIDVQNLVAGRATPVLTTHLWLSVVLYPIFGLTFVGLIVASVRDRVLGSVWIAWLGILGVVAPAAAAPLVVLLGVEGARNLFPLLVLFAIWVLLVGLWPMRARRVSTLAPALFLLSAAQPPPHDLPVAAPNDNRVPAGTLRDRVLTVGLEAMTTMWYPDGDSLPGMTIEAFAESGKRPLAPGPLLRVPAGTELRASIRNSLPRDTITFYLPGNVAAGKDAGALDSIVVPPGAVRELRVRADRPGNYVYRANANTALDQALGMRGFLAGALVVDSAGSAPGRDRVFVLLDAVDSITPGGLPSARREVLAINGRSWPHTEPIEATVGDSLFWRVLNASPSVHPMHLHGFYYRIDAFAGPVALQESQKAAGRMVVTERMTPFTTMSMLWVPTRPGNWLFHCHFQHHATPHRPLAPAPPARQRAKHENHARTGMGGLVMGIQVNPRSSDSGEEPAASRRALRLIAVRDSGFPDSVPSLRFVLQDRASGRTLAARPGFSPTIDLIRGEPVSITVVNRLAEPTAVHWHGIELESYFDGVAGFAGQGARLAPLIAPGDSFEARFTPPRSGTFVYHSHVDEPRQHRAGLVGALIVRDRAPRDSTGEHLFFIKSPRHTTAPSPMEINGEVNPDTTVLRVGRRYRFRFIGLPVTSPNATVFLTARPDSSLANLRDTMLVRWRPLAKDGADLPERERAMRLAQQVVSIGETFDFEFQPVERGDLRIEVRPPSAGRLFARVPVRVE